MDNYKEYLDPADGYALVKQSVNMPVRPHWIDIPEGADCLMQWPTGHKVFYRDNFAKSWNSAYREWQFVSGDDGIDQSSTLWKRATQDPALISGAEALRALADGKEVEYNWLNQKSSKWMLISEELKQFNLYEILSGTTEFGAIKFRLKPQTIKLELELPKPFEPKVGDLYWCIAMTNLRGYTQKVYKDDGDDECLIHLGAYRTEDEIKQVVAQLRKIRGTNS